MNPSNTIKSDMQRFLITLFFLLSPGLAFAQGEVTVTDSDISAGATVTWTADNTYLLDGIVFVDSAATLIIEPGTVIKGNTGEGNNASALVVTRYAQIYAEGSAENPIIFTSVLDEFDGTLTAADRGLWGGVVMLGRASTNNQTEGGLKEVEGINEITGEGDTRATYGGDEDAHSSGVFRYVSIRHTGINVGDQAGNEIQGLTLGGVGSGTVVEYVESFASADDGFEWFGGAVNTKYLVSAFNEDDSFDWDEGFRGKGQFWFAIQGDDVGGRTAEQDGATGNEFFQPLCYAETLQRNLHRPQRRHGRRRWRRDAHVPGQHRRELTTTRSSPSTAQPQAGLRSRWKTSTTRAIRRKTAGSGSKTAT